MHHLTTLIFVLVICTLVAKVLLWARPYVPAFSILEHKELLLIMISFVIVAIVVSYGMYPTILSFDTAKVGLLPEYKRPPPMECW